MQNSHSCNAPRPCIRGRTTRYREPVRARIATRCPADESTQNVPAISSRHAQTKPDIQHPAAPDSGQPISPRQRQRTPAPRQTIATRMATDHNTAATTDPVWPGIIECHRDHRPASTTPIQEKPAARSTKQKPLRKPRPTARSQDYQPSHPQPPNRYPTNRQTPRRPEK